MKKLSTLILFGGIILATASCKKGECTCTILGNEISQEYEAEDRDEYNDLKGACEDAGCEWKAKL